MELNELNSRVTYLSLVWKFNKNIKNFRLGWLVYLRYWANEYLNELASVAEVMVVVHQYLWSASYFPFHNSLKTIPYEAGNYIENVFDRCFCWSNVFFHKLSGFSHESKIWKGRFTKWIVWCDSSSSLFSFSYTRLGYLVKFVCCTEEIQRERERYSLLTSPKGSFSAQKIKLE